MALFGAGCSATPTWIAVDSAGVTADATEPTSGLGTVDTAADLAATDANSDSANSDGANSDGATPGEIQAGEAPAELAFVDADPDAVPAASPGFCTATANIWIHSAALNMLGADSNPEMDRVAIANVAEWLERATIFEEPASAERAVLFAAFTDLQEIVEQDFGYDWAEFQQSSEYANNTSAQTYEAARDALLPFLGTACDGVTMADLRTQADERAEELRAEFAGDPSTVVNSDALPGHSIFTHSSGRLIASFPGRWQHEEKRDDAIADFIASPDIGRFMAGEAIDGVRLQLVDAATLDDFRDLIDATMTATLCERTNDLMDTGATRLNLTQTYACDDHEASIIGQYSEERGAGLIIEAAFDGPEASRADMLRLATISNSALWS